MRGQVLVNAGQSVDYQANNSGPFIRFLNAEMDAGKGINGLLGALHDDFATMEPANLVDFSAMDTTGVDAAVTAWEAFRSLVWDNFKLLDASPFQIVDMGFNDILLHSRAEYYDPVDGTSCGGDHFTWRAAMVIEFIK